MGQGGGQGETGRQRAVWEQRSMHRFHPLGSLQKPHNSSDLAGDEGGGGGRRGRAVGKMAGTLPGATKSAPLPD